MNEPALDGMAQTALNRADPLFRKGNTNCGGCGMSLTLQMLRHAVAERPVHLVIPASCAAVAGGTFPQSTFGVPTLMTTFASAPAAASGGHQRGRAQRRRPARDHPGRATVAPSISASPVCRRRRSATRTFSTSATTTRFTATPADSVRPPPPPAPSPPTRPTAKWSRKKTSSPSWRRTASHTPPRSRSPTRRTLHRKLRYALDLKGFRFLHVLSPCPTGWKSEPALGLELVRLAVRSGLFPVYEIFDGKRHVVNIEPDFSDEALNMYLSLQRRFQKSGLAAADLRPAIDRNWQNLRALSGRIVPARRDG